MIAWVLGAVVVGLGIVAIFGLVFGAVHIEYTLQRRQNRRQRVSGGPHEYETTTRTQSTGEAQTAPCAPFSRR